MRIDFETYEVIFEIYLGDKLVQKQSMQAPRIILERQFVNLANEIANDERPMRIKMIKPEVIWDQFEQKHKVLNNYIEFRNYPVEEEQYDN